MTRSHRTLILVPLLGALLALTACAPQGTPPDPRLLVKRSQIDRAPEPLLLTALPGRGGGTMIVQGRRDGVLTWRTADFISISYRDGLLVATRGLGPDLMSADVAGTRAALSGGPRDDYPRFASFLGPDDETVLRAMRCRMRDAGPDPVQSFGLAFPATRLEETCTGTGLRITNTYWMAPGGGLRRSLQWAGPELGYLETEQISRDILER